MAVEIIANFLELITLVSGIGIILIVLGWLYSKATGWKADWFGNLLKENYFLFGLLVSLAATLGSLYYSDIRGFAPCVLCWYQRILMYPQVLLFIVAWTKRDWRIFRYSLVLSILGALLAAYHYLGQISVVKGLPCEAIGYSSSCAETFFLAYGYITIPMMSFTAFVLLIILGINMMKRN